MLHFLRVIVNLLAPITAFSGQYFVYCLIEIDNVFELKFPEIVLDLIPPLPPDHIYVLLPFTFTSKKSEPVIEPYIIPSK